jgi:broad specificity phosphatase PhoE
MCGWTDLPADLSDLCALNRLSLRLPEAPVVSSDLRRAVATADALADGRPRLPHEPGLREIHFGAWEMRTHAECEAEDPVLARAIWDEPGVHAPPGGEGWDAFGRRVLAAVERLLAGHPGDLILVCHFGTILSLVQRARSIPAVEAFAQRIEPLSLTVLRWEPERAVELVDHRP